MTQRVTHIIFSVRHLVRLLTLAILLCALLPQPTIYARAPQINAEYKLKAAFLYNFTRFVEWPENAFSSTTSPVIIGIIGEDPFGAFIDELVSNEKIGNRSIIIRRFKGVTDIANCHILYICYQQTEKIAAVLSTASNKGILTIADAPPFTRMGGMVQFYTDKNKIRMQINNGAAKRAGLNISTKLLSVAKVVN